MHFASFLRLIMPPSVACLTQPYCSMLSIYTLLGFRGNIIEQKRVFWFSRQLLSEIFPFQRTVYEILSKMHIKYPLFLSDFYQNWIFPVSFIFEENLLEKKKNYMLNFTKIRPVGTEWFHSNRQKDGRMDVTKLIYIYFFSFCERA
jgi:hypothetical protein